MRFMIIRRADKSTEAGVRPSKKLLDAMTRYHEEGARAGIVLDGVGLHPSSKGTRVTIAGGKPMVTDGPFTETKELIAGFTMIEVKSKEEAIAWVKGWPREDGDVELEIRQLFDAEEFAALVEDSGRRTEQP
jgi:hypothetical protein